MAAARDDGKFYLPDFCAARNVLVVVVVAELVAVVLAIARVGLHPQFLPDLARTSLFLLWIALGSAAALCWLRPRLAALGIERGSVATLGVLLVVTGLVSEAAWWAAARGYAAVADPAGFAARSHVAFTLGNLAICAIVGAIGLRYFYVAHQWRRNVEGEARARVDALQARIRPHFLYNSMNTIAALTRTDPAQAETAVEDLADLFRASLAETRHEVAIEDELEIARTYQRMEQLRLGPRLRVEWRLDGVPHGALVPSLIVQPLLENAIYHGIERLPGGGTVSVEGRVLDGRLELVVANPRVPEAALPGRTGNRVALANIRERLELAYPGAASLSAAIETGEHGERYVVRVRFPLREMPADRPSARGAPGGAPPQLQTSEDER
jgi:two-component system sensor histidine kinase AlgZ